jgi:Flp pilus assembly protein TadG
MKNLMASDQGGSLMETAVSLGLLMIVIIGIAGGGLMLYTYHYLSYAARLGSRYAIVRGSACTGFPSACPAAAADIQSYVQTLTAVGINPVNLNVTATWCTSSSSPCTCTVSSGDPLCNNPGDQIRVTVQYPFFLSVPFIPTSQVNMSSSSQTIISQ